MKLNLIPISTLVGVAYSKSDECSYALEVLQVQDGSSSFISHVENMKATTTELVAKLAQSFGEFKYGVSSFVDKPIPTRGLGWYGNYKSWGSDIDWCYALHADMTSDPAKIKAGLEDLSSGMGGGGDFPENPYEGLVFAAYSKTAGWTPPGVSHAPSGRPIARIALVFTDDIPHVEGDAVNGANLGWNQPRDYSNPDYSKGGFGSMKWGDSAFIFYNDSILDEEKGLYAEMADLFKIVDLGGVLTNKQEARLDTLVAKFGPYPWPKILDHPGDDSMECTLTEYPSLTQVAAALNKHKILPIFLVAKPDPFSLVTSRLCSSIGADLTVDCLVKSYTQDLENMGVKGVVQAIGQDNLLDEIIQAISEATEKICLEPTEPPVIATEPEVTEPEVTKPEVTEPEVDETEPEVDETEPEVEDTKPGVEDTKPGVEDTKPEVDETEPEVDETEPEVDETEPEVDETEPEVDETDPEVDDTKSVVDETDPEVDETKSVAGTKPEVTTGPAAGGDATTTTTSQAGSGPNIGMIAGAAGGAVAGVAAVAGLLYKKVGMSMFGNSAPADMTQVQQVETPDSPVERETMEEVTMDMFQ